MKLYKILWVDRSDFSKTFILCFLFYFMCKTGARF